MVLLFCLAKQRISGLATDSDHFTMGMIGADLLPVHINCTYNHKFGYNNVKTKIALLAEKLVTTLYTVV